MPKPDKKQRRAAKQAEKKKEARRRDSISPAKRLADAPGELECWMSDDFEGNGQLSIHVFKRADGVMGMASFLVDRGVVGLKDAWTVIPFERSQRQMLFDKTRESGIGLLKVSPEVVCRWVASAARWAFDNGMRLPKDWIKAVAIVGPIGDWHSADVSAFVKEFAGHPEDLRQRLIGEPFETYVKRSDVHFIFSNDVSYKDQSTGDYVDGSDEFDLDDELSDEELAEALPDEEIDELMSRFAPVADELSKQTASWLTAKGELPSPELSNAWSAVSMSTVLVNAASPEGGLSDEAKRDTSFEILRDLSKRVDPAVSAEYQRAIGQCLEHLLFDPNLIKAAHMKFA